MPGAMPAASGGRRPANGNSIWDRLGEYVEKQVTHTDVFIINRSVEAHVETLFDLWTTHEHLAAWLPPTGFTMQFRRVSIRPGGDGFYAMTNGTFTMYGRVGYLMVDRPTRLEYAQCFPDEHEHLAWHPGAPTWPATMRTRVTFAAEGEAQTRVTARSSVEGHATEAEVAAFVAERDGMTKGWTGSFDKLDELLATA